MKLFSKEQIYKGDKLTTERQKIASTDLMERAGTQIFNWIHSRMQGAQVPIHVFCGIGNRNGAKNKDYKMGGTDWSRCRFDGTDCIIRTDGVE